MAQAWQGELSAVAALGKQRDKHDVFGNVDKKVKTYFIYDVPNSY